MGGRLPPSVLSKWTQLKHDLMSAIDEMGKDPAKPPKIKIDAAYRKDLKGKVTELYGEFNKGLSAKLKTASTAKSDSDAKAAMTAARDLAKEYLASTRKAKERWGTNGRGVAEKFEKALKNIDEACTSTLKAMK